jgi:hypothetical protein
MDYVKKEMARGLDGWEQRLSTALVKSSPTDLVRHSPKTESEKAIDSTKSQARSSS